MHTALHRLSITLDDVSPAVHRDLVVPSNLRLDQLHQVLQTVMGWDDSHLHMFIVESGQDVLRYGAPDPDFEDFGMPVKAENRYTLEQLAPAAGSGFDYWYDFGDDWHHSIEVTAVMDAASLEAGEGIHCIAAQGACPPEDCGGPPGYTHLLECLRDPAHPEHRDAKRWVGGPFDPDVVDLDQINRNLAALAAAFTAARKAHANRPATRRSRTAQVAARRSTGRATAAPALMLEPLLASEFITYYRGILLDIAGPPGKRQNVIEHLIHARNLLAREPERLAATLERLHGTDEIPHEDVIDALRDFRVQHWIYLRDTRSHSIFLEPDGSAAYGVLGLTQRIREISQGSGVVVTAALLNFRGCIICDGLIATGATLGPGIRRDYTAQLAQARADGRYSTTALFPRTQGD